MSKTCLNRATVLTEALPYIQRYNGKIVVINCGGSAMESEALRGAVATDVALLQLVGVQVVLVHGLSAGADADAAQQVLCGKINKNLAAALNRGGCKAVGLCGLDGGMLSAQDGALSRVDPAMLLDAMSTGYTPVVAAVAQEGDGSAAVDPDGVAAKLAVALKAEKLIHLVAPEQLLRDGGGEVIPVLELSQVPALIRGGSLPEDMAGKINHSVEAVRSGVKSATLLDGGDPHAILLELLSDEGTGTMLTH